MSLVNNESWYPNAYEARPSLLKRKLHLWPIERLRKHWRATKSVDATATSNSLKFRLLLASLVGPSSAYVALATINGLAQPQWVMTVAALSTCAGLVVARGAVTETLRPLSDLALAAGRLSIGGRNERLAEHGSSEASIAARAFNDMSERVTRQFEERIQLLSAFSHDVQTPITRMRLRVELADDFPDRNKILADLREAERLVKDGIAYARNAHLTKESDVLVDLGAFVESIAFDYQDTGRKVSITEIPQGKRAVKPAALRRILSNFIDNALKFAGSAEIAMSRTTEGAWSITVMDRGPGIAQDKLDAALRPFVRLEQTTEDETPGVGLGLSIAQQLAHEMNASILLENRQDGGLSARIIFGP